MKKSHLESSNQWFSYFRRGWHLNIPKCKMSESSTNSITFEEALEKYNVQQLRLLCLLHLWSSSVDYSDDEMDKAVAYEAMLNDFFRSVKTHSGAFKKSNNSKAETKLDEHDRTLNKHFSTSKKKN